MEGVALRTRVVRRRHFRLEPAVIGRPRELNSSRISVLTSTAPTARAALLVAGMAMLDIGRFGAIIDGQSE